MIPVNGLVLLCVDHATLSHGHSTKRMLKGTERAKLVSAFHFDLIDARVLVR